VEKKVLFHTVGENVIGTENSMMFLKKVKKKKIPAMPLLGI
jgi:hypothetical protein